MREVIWEGPLVSGPTFRVVVDREEMVVGRRTGQVIVERQDDPAAMGEVCWTRIRIDHVDEFWLLLVAELIAKFLPHPEPRRDG